VGLSVCQSMLCCAYRVNCSIKYIRQGLVLFVYVFVAFLAQSPETAGDGGECLISSRLLFSHFFTVLCVKHSLLTRDIC